MNNSRRKAIESLIDQIEEYAGALRDAVGELESLYEQEQESYDNLPDPLQGSERGQEMAEAASSLEHASSELEGSAEAAEQVAADLRELI